MVSTPFKYEKIEVEFEGEKLYYIRFNEQILNLYSERPKPVEERLGYVWDLSKHVFNISFDISAIIAAGAWFVFTTADDFIKILVWIEKGATMFTMAVKGVPPPMDYFKNWAIEIEDVVVAVRNIIIAAVAGGIL